MDYQQPKRETIKEILDTAKTIAVVGLSDKPDRTSYQVSKVMQAQGYRIIPVNPTIDEALGEKAYSTLEDVPDSIDIINVFRRSVFLKDVAEQAVKTDAKVFWAQQGIFDQDVYEELTNKGFSVIMDMCIKVAHAVTKN
ncbi:CoA-binding protein [Paraliobacillus quinghaiensis]|uniref:CoA-binding protein n=1 Tax=Paraliobacillus quinghaiensis TaxID=470815 RepID=A0A917TU83_9BACI|nr:CoA-binding protein [Paraliobacillus quinghaiensis]GGM37692.1 CoA-binding protein [Paraliobacillus quinghaiensis]